MHFFDGAGLRALVCAKGGAFGQFSQGHLTRATLHRPVIGHLAFVICHLAFAICHLAFALRHLAFAIPRSEFPGGTALAEPTGESEPITLRPFIQEEHREAFIEIYEANPGPRLVTSVEVLSPSNKRPGTQGWELYRASGKVYYQAM